MPSSCSRGTASAAIVLGAITLGCAAAADDSDIDDFARAPAYALASLSPDGEHFSYVEQSEQRQRVVIRALADGSEQRALSLKPVSERVRWCGWAGARHLLCGTILPFRKQSRIWERTRLHAIEVGARGARELNVQLEDPIRDHVIDLMPASATTVLLQHDSTGQGYPDVSELDVATGALRRVVRARQPVRRWMSDGRGEIRLGIGYEPGVASLLIRDQADRRWTTFLKQSLTDAEAIAPLAFGPTSHDLYALKHHKGRTALFHIDLQAQRSASLLFADPVYDIAGPPVLDPRSKKLLAVRYLAQQERTHYFDESAAALQRQIDEELPNAVNTIVDRAMDARAVLVRSMSDIEPPSWYLFDARARRTTLLGHDYEALEGRDLAPTLPTIYRARDGQRIPAFLTLPRGGASSDLPAVVLPHGGPETRDSKTFDPLVQFLASNGYAVLQMNFRGSFGYGARFAAAGAGQWGGVIHNDITDGARWLVEQKIADPTRICIAGISFGGYAALLGAAREAQWYACAASYAGAADLMAFSQYTERLANPEIWRERLGTDPRALWQMSPMARVRLMEMPILLMHGRNDPVVPVSQARRLARALEREGKPHRFIERGDCDHELTIESCRRVFFTELQQFLATAIGSR